MRFLADNMLGRLTKWLRFMGHDVLYPNILDDAELVELSRKDDRLLLTRDKELTKRRELEVLYIVSDNLDEQLKQLKNDLDLTVTAQAFNRCPECNQILVKKEKSLVEEDVPEGVYKNQEEFWFCESCDQYFWEGTHHQKIARKIKEIFD
jgi:uncharacterized protein with PIN domain